MPLRGLQIAALVMGLAIVVGVTVLAASIVHRMATAPPRAFAAAPLDIPQGARIETIGVGAQRLVLDIVLPDGGRRLVVIDLASGRQVGTIPLRTAQ